MCLGIPGRILSVHDDAGLRMATVDFGGVRREVCLEYTPDASPDAYVIVHVGFAITTVDEQEAQRTLGVLRAMGDAVAGELGEPLPTGSAHRGTASPGRGPTARPGQGRSAP
ncbi:HypC/HybG/HupF family hydrogenase formation chaperone [Streptomyces purpurogeneiscleroticus]|uniref:HypC/HybG/HupF family hydrogenase formation chaperone n=1 Tax=Streptomyces purpurogeneiscleroticus TaxID=68259 RepID=UPI001CBB36F0|nr:HypC/HybG/HupF family hydrogenase formation chaperone [Streptomyces purpurogeneiscleroticus]MBZ4018749.1 hydrogenase assembly protein HypC [Streptomyces purpurogeneiscleroticus]